MAEPKTIYVCFHGEASYEGDWSEMQCAFRSESEAIAYVEERKFAQDLVQEQWAEWHANNPYPRVPADKLAAARKTHSASFEELSAEIGRETAYHFWYEGTELN